MVATLTCIRRFQIVPCELGQMLIVATDRGICRIEFADTAEELEASVRQRYSDVELCVGDEAFSGWIDAILDLVASPGSACDLPLDLSGTAFQRQVWQALCEIAPGSTATYTQIANRIGRPTAARAVAQACGSNPVAVIIPCHRVIGAAGELRGYRWGVDRKRKLLDCEKTAEARRFA